MRILSYFVVFILGGAFVFGLHQIKSMNGPQHLIRGSADLEVALSYTDFVTIMFTGATLALTALAVIIGIAAVFSFQGIKREAGSVVKMEVKKHMAHLDERIRKEADEKISTAVFEAGRGGQLDEALERAILAIGQGDANLSGELEGGFDPEETYER